MMDCQSEHLGVFEVDDQLILGRSLHGKVGNFFDPLGCDRRNRRLVETDRPGRSVGNQFAVSYEEPESAPGVCPHAAFPR